MGRRHRGEGSFFYDEKTELWVGEIYLGYVAGKRKRKRVTSKSQAVALAKFTALKDDVRKGVVGKDPTVESWLNEWLTDIVEMRAKPKTARTYRTYCEQYLIPILGRKRLSKLEPRDVRELHREMRKMITRRGTPLSETTIHHAHRILGTALIRAAKEGKAVHPDVVKNADAPVVAPSSQGVLTGEQALRILRTCDDPRMQSRWLAAFTLGARQGELLGLRWSHVDLDAGIADLAWSLQAIYYAHGCKGDCGKRPASCPQKRLAVPPGLDYIQLHKGLCLVRPKTAGSIRVVALGPVLHEALRLWHDLGADEPNPHDLVWRNPDGRPLDGRRDYEEWQRLLVRARVPRVALHEARHAAITMMNKAGVPESVRMEIAGHSVVATNRRYTHIDLEQRQAAAAALSKVLEG